MKKSKQLLIFFTLGVSLKSWVDSGLFSREVKIYKKLIKNGYKVTFITYGDSSDYNYKSLLGEITVHPFFGNYSGTNSKVKKLFYIFLNIFKNKKLFLKSDLFMTNQMRGAWVPLICKIFYKRPMIVRCGHEWFRNALRDKNFGLNKIGLYVFGYLLELIIYTFSDKIIISSRTDEIFINKIFPINRNKIFFIRNFIDTSIFNPNNKYPNSNERLNSILYIGRIINRKNIDLIIKSLSSTKYKLFIVGEGPEKERLINFAEEQKVELKFLGIYSNDLLPKIINQFPIFILPSLYENSPKTLLEAMSCGRAIIATDVDGNNELIKHEISGLLCNINQKTIIEHVERLFNSNKLRNELGKNAVKFIHKQCRLDSLVPKYEKIINSLII